MDNKGLSFKLAFFALIAVSMVTIAVGVMVNDWNTQYNSGLASDLGEFDKLDTIQGHAESQEGNLSVSTALEDVDFEGKSIRGAFGILSNIYAPFRTVFGNDGMIDSVTERFGLPDWIRQSIVTMMVLAITFALIAIFFGRGSVTRV